MSPIAIAGYAALFGVADLAGDVVHRGAFTRTLAERGPPPMWLSHEPRLALGRWRSAQEDARGLFVCGEIGPGHPGFLRARAAIAEGLDGLSIGFSALDWRRRPGGGRELLDLELWEVSLVAVPMSPPARFWRVDQPARTGRMI
jgi:HK97 family phage prohead protease